MDNIIENQQQPIATQDPSALTNKEKDVSPQSENKIIKLKKIKIPRIFIALLILLSISTIGVFAYQYYQKSNEARESFTSSDNSPRPTQTPEPSAFSNEENINPQECLVDNDCILESFRKEECCSLGCHEFTKEEAINRKAAEIRRQWRDQNCESTICPVFECIDKRYFFEAKCINKICEAVKEFPQKSPTLIEQRKLECQEQGGEWKKWGLGEKCVIKTADFNKDCTDSDQCEGQCLAPAGVDVGENVVGNCSEYNITLGCYSSVYQGKSTPVICAD